MKSEKTYYIENLGCAKNQVDAEVMIAALEKAGWICVIEPRLAAVIIVNTCGFIDEAKAESVDVLISFRDAFPDAAVIAAGCLAERYSGDLAGSMPELDGIFGNADPSLIASFLEQQASSEGQLVKVPEIPAPDSPDNERGDLLSVNRSTLLSPPGTAYVKTAEGCSNNCSFCAIPIIRGPLRSRRIESIVAEVLNLTAAGITEINLIAQDLGSYGIDPAPDFENPSAAGGKGHCLLPELLRELDALPGDFSVRMLYIHPDNFPLEILDICATSRRILPYFDIPFQHASRPVLSAMNRRGNAEQYLALLEKIRGKLPDAAIRTTFLLGFPGETAADVAALEDFIIRAKIDWAGFFVYSREEGTPACRLESAGRHKKGKKTAQRNVERLQHLQQEITSEALRRFTGRRVELIVEEGVVGEDLYLCRAWMQAPEVDGLTVLCAEENSLKPGQRIQAELTAVNGVDFEAMPVS